MTDAIYMVNDLEKTLFNKISECGQLLEDAKIRLSGKIGANRLLSKIISEKRFLLKLSKTPERIKEEHIRSTNLTHLSSILNCISQSRNVSEVLKPLMFEDEQSNFVRQVVIDVLADQGKTWIKVVARNPQSVYLSSLGATGYGKRSLVHQVKDLVNCAKLNPFMYETPIVKVWFAAGVAIQLKKALLKINVESIGNCVEVEEQYIDDDYSDETECVEDTISDNNSVKAEDICTETSLVESFIHSPYLVKNKNLLSLSQIPEKSVLNLDVSTMIAYVSSLTNGHCNFIFEDVILSDQATRERANSVKPILDQLFEGRSLICCKLAHHYFQEIISTIGGINERERAEKLLERVSIVPDDPSDKAMALNISSKVKIRTRVIFGTGDNLKAVTVTANQGFLRACEGQGVKFVSFLHESRALTELKEATAKEI